MVCPAFEVQTLIFDTVKLLVMLLSTMSFKFLNTRGFLSGGDAIPNDWSVCSMHFRSTSAVTQQNSTASKAVNFIF